MRKRRACAEVVCASYDFSKDLHFWGFKRAHDDAAYAFALISLKDIRGTDVFTHAASVAFERVNDWTAPGIQGDCIIGTRFITFSAGSSTQGNAGFRHYGNADAHSFGSKVFDGSGGTDFCAFLQNRSVQGERSSPGYASQRNPVSKCAMPTALVWQTLRHLSQRMQRARNSASGRLPGGRTRDASDTVE